MPFSLSPSKLKTKTKAKEGKEECPPSPPRSPTRMRRLSGKFAEKVKRQLWRLDEALHHVTHTKHDPNEAIVRVRTTSLPSHHVLVAPADISPPSPSSSRSSSTWNDKYPRDADTKSFDAASIASSALEDHQLSNILPPISVDILPQMPEEQPQHPLPEPPLPEPPVSADNDHGADAEQPSPSEPMFTSPPTVFIEEETPDPFLIDDEGDAASVGDEKQDSSAGVSQYTVSPAQNVPLDLPESDRSQPPASPRPNVNKDVPPPPPSESEEEEEVPDIYVPALVAPTMFLPIPNTDPLTTLLNKYIYPPERRPMRDLTGDWQRSDFHTLVITNSWRALARMARDRLVTSDPSDLTLVLGLWHLRLSCLARLRLFNQTSAETTNLFTVLSGIEPAETRAYVFERLLPFELEVMQTRLKYWAGDHMGYLDALNALLKKCRTKCRQAGGDATLVPMWKERGARVALIIASQMVEMKEITAAAKLLEPLCHQDGVSSPALRSSVGRIYLQGGNVQAAAQHFGEIEADSSASLTLKMMNAALLAAAEGDWSEASERFKGIIEQDAENYAAVNNLSVALLSQGRLKEAIEALEKALHASPSSVVVAEPFLFNLSTLYELRSTTGFEKKKDLLVEVAKWGGDGLRTNCLKMPA
ncbi:hypothetical protein BDN70DRAFT_880959, partial [Pholiota conissans]